MEKSIKNLFVDFIEDRCSDPEIDRVRELMHQKKYEAEWREAMEETEGRITAKDHQKLIINDDKLFERIKRSTGLNRPVRAYQWISYAASLLVLLSISVIFLKHSVQKEAVAIAAVKKTGSALKGSIHKWIKLPDGSSVQLNSASHLDYPQTFAGSGTREVTLTGEAYFDIKHDALHPFIIHTGKIKTTVLGTAFNISAYRADKGVTVTVTRGKVKVEDEQRVLAILTPDQQLVWNNKQPAVKAVVSAETVIAWKNSDLIMDDITLGEAARLITAHYGLQVHFTNDKVKNCRFTAAFLNSNEIEQVLNVLGDITGASLTIKDHTITIDGNGC